VLEITVIHDP